MFDSELNGLKNVVEHATWLRLSHNVAVTLCVCWEELSEDSTDGNVLDMIETKEGMKKIRQLK